ncbi:MAG: DUF445 family protein [Spirochaeta sp.]|jgi:uncharacterized membrane-anchored protein YjiN (DUF445 family)|nr:DUF445 family protein [Spirochaeta sp.]
MIDADTFSAVVPWVLPPLLGAGIGYLTNSLAIRMLFRPLSRVKVFGVPLPFTPGVIPRQRRELAESIGTMVSRDLLTPEVFTERFRTPGFRRGIRRGLYRILDEIALSSVATVRGFVEPERVVAAVGDQLIRHVCGNDETVDRLSRAVATAVVTGHDEVATVVQEAIDEIRPFAAVDRETAERVVTALWPEIRRSVEELLREEQTRRKFEEIVRRVLAYTLDQLTGLQRLVVSAGQYDRQILARVPSIVSRATAEIGAVLANPETRIAVVDRVDDWLRGHRDASIAMTVPHDARDALGDVLRHALSDPTVVEAHIRPVVASLVDGPACRKMFARVEEMAKQWLMEHENLPFGALFPPLARGKAFVAYRFAGHVTTILSDLTPRLLVHLDIQNVVVERIDKLEIDRVEELLLGIIRRHLRWINVFGAILGALIGASQLVLRVLGV